MVENTQSQARTEVETDAPAPRSGKDPGLAHAKKLSGIIWKPILFVDEALVSNFGQIKRKDRFGAWDVAPKHINKKQHGYEYVRLNVEGKPKMFRTHLLVLRVFVGEPPSPRHHGAHGERGRLCNELSNLRWATPEENEADKRATKSHRNGRVHRRSTAREVRKIRDLFFTYGMSYTAIGRRMKMHRSSVSRIVRGKRHGNVS